jgi:M61 glycyl aminopeptidase
MRVGVHARLFFAGLLFTLFAGTVPAGEDTRQTLTRDGRNLDLHISSQFDRDAREQLQAWVTFIADSLLQVYGRWPRQEWQITISPAPATGSDPIPWAQVHRDAVDRVEFYTAAQASTAELKQAWTGYHELAHLLIPYRGWGDMWFSEGMASYYQNILMARAGVLTEQQMWQKLYEGFLRGRADARFNGEPLADVSASLRDKGGFMRVYWSGAWYFLAIDVRLRRQSGGQLSLDLALEKLNRCCADQRLSVKQIVNKLDQLNQVLMFEPLYQQVKASEEVPAFATLFASLGVSIEGDKVVLQQEGPGAELRRQIVQGPSL